MAQQKGGMSGLQGGQRVGGSHIRVPPPIPPLFLLGETGYLLLYCSTGL